MIVNYSRQNDYKLDRTKLRTDNRAAGNSSLAIGGVSSPLDSFVVAENLVFLINFCAENPPHRQSAKVRRNYHRHV
jgi:hypothetical protein